MNEILMHLQNPTVKKNLQLLRNMKSIARKFLEDSGFEEFDTPVLSPKTGEVYNPAFDIIIESHSVILADSPQLYKLMLSHSGYNNYFQFAHCFRPIAHENNMHNRLCEFTQIDMEWKGNSLDDLLSFAHSLLVEIFETLHLSYRFHKIDGITCRNQYGMDMKPVLSDKDKDVTVIFIERLPLTNGEKTSDGFLMPCHHIFALPSSPVEQDQIAYLKKIQTESFDIIINGIEVGGGDLRIMDPNEQKKLMDLFAVNKECYCNYLHILEQSNAAQSCGFSIGLERLTMALSGCEDIRQTLCFPDYYKHR